jgi:hypothetical protein
MRTQRYASNGASLRTREGCGVRALLNGSSQSLAAVWHHAVINRQIKR